MVRFFKILLILLFALSLGFLFGVNNTPQTVNVYNASGQLVKSQINQSATSVFFPGLKAESTPWYISRSTAIAAYLLLFAIVVWGMGMTVGFTYKFYDPARAWQIHQNMSISLAVLLIVHPFSLLFDKFMNFKILDLLLPFYSSFKAIFLSLGIVGFYILLIVIVTSIFMRLKAPRLWRYGHYLTYPLFILATIHGFFIGTDSSSLVMRAIYSLASLVFLLVFYSRFVVYPWRRRFL
jgi:predicted ferric reductase